VRSDLRLPDECSDVVLDAETIAARVAELGREVRDRHPGELLRLVTVLRGGVFFLADLCRAIGGDVTIDFLSVQPYAIGTGGKVRITKDLDDDVSNSVVILVEDVVDTGLTLNYVLSFLRSHDPSSIEVCALLDKPARRIAEVPIDYLGFSMSDKFLVGYGLDFHGLYRGLPFIAELAEEAVYG
jgi:hypoxanthine phosphoribosyltransferase